MSENQSKQAKQATGAAVSDKEKREPDATAVPKNTTEPERTQQKPKPENPEESEGTGKSEPASQILMAQVVISPKTGQVWTSLEGPWSMKWTKLATRDIRHAAKEKKRDLLRDLRPLVQKALNSKMRHVRERLIAHLPEESQPIATRIMDEETDNG